MKCVKCGGEVQQAAFCGCCGWEQSRIPFEPTATELKVLWSRYHYKKIGKKGVAGYETAWKHCSSIADAPFSTLGLNDFQRVIDAHAHQSKSQQQKIQQLISQLCKYGMLLGCCKLNYAPYLALDGRQSEEYNLFQPQHIAKLIEFADSPHSQDWERDTAQIILILVFSGWRPEELFAIKKENVFLKERFLVSGSKTKAGKNRLMPIMSLIYPYIEGRYKVCETNGYLVKSPKGAKMNLRNWRERKFYPLLQQMGANPPDAQQFIKPYSARHTFATLAYRAGVKQELLIKMIGHTKFELTTKIYIHNQADEYLAEIEKVEKYWKETTKRGETDSLWSPLGLIVNE